MELVLKRSYYPEGTNGELWYRGLLIGYTIELPWLQNQPCVSCIPEGSYKLAMKYTAGYGWQIYIPEGTANSKIYFCPVNSVLEMGTGCIAPVSQLMGRGHGIASDFATRQLERLVFEAFDREKDIFITIKRKDIMNVLERAKAPTPKFFKIIRTVGLALAAAGGAILASPIALPAGIAAIGGYLALGGGILTAVSQVTVDEEAKAKSTTKGDD